MNQAGTKARWIVLGLGGALFLYILIQTAWVSDDSYIAFRTIDNFVRGFGLRYNIVERVWTYTNPLWVLLLTPIYYLTREIYYTSLIFSLVVSIAAFVVLIKGVCRTFAAALFGVAVVCFSKSFTDFSTSGLENPLTHLCLAAFFAIFIGRPTMKHRIFWLSFIAGLGVFNRMDTLLLYCPALAMVCWPQRSWKTLWTVVLGFAPLIVWEMFAFVYYGFPLPNTFYAKSHLGVGLWDVIRQGFVYFHTTAVIDPLTVVVIAVSIGAAAYVRNRVTISLAAGILIYLAYVLIVGGDFMAGRFLTAPLVVAVAIIATARLPEKPLLAPIPALIAVAVGFLSPAVPILSNSDFAKGKFGQIDPSGVVDERAYYYEHTGLLKAKKAGIWPDIIWAQEGLALKPRGSVAIIERSVGFRAWFAGPMVHVCDMYALVDPFMARLPCETRLGWRTGHLTRTAPDGFESTLATEHNMLADTCLREYVDRLWIVVRGPVFSWDRFVEMARFNLGLNDYLIKAAFNPPIAVVSYPQISQPEARGTPVTSPGVRRLNHTGLRVALDSVSHAKELEISVDDGDYYYLLFRRDSLAVGSARADRRVIPGGGLRVDTVAVPDSCRTRGFDSIDIAGFYGDDRYYVGHLRLLDQR